ncbi:uncharacterized protein LOC102806092 [Saccoglossus kowalevskii]
MLQYVLDRQLLQKKMFRGRPTSVSVSETSNRLAVGGDTPDDKVAHSSGDSDDQTLVKPKNENNRLLYTRKQYKKLTLKLISLSEEYHKKMYELNVMRGMIKRLLANNRFQQRRLRLSSQLENVQLKRETCTTRKQKSKDHLEDAEFEIKVWRLREENERLWKKVEHLEQTKRETPDNAAAIDDMMLNFAQLLGVHACERSDAISFSKMMMDKFIDDNTWTDDDVILWKGYTYKRDDTILTP